MMYAVYIPRMHMVPQTARGTICMRIHDLAAVRGKLYCDCVQYPYRLTSFHTCRHEGGEYSPIICQKRYRKIKGVSNDLEEILFNIEPNYQITFPSELTKKIGTIQQLCHNFTSNNCHQTPPISNHAE